MNPDGSKGARTACQARHQFSIEVARKPKTCSQCHKGPDVPAYAVYLVSKHGNVYESLEAKWDFFPRFPGSRACTLRRPPAPPATRACSRPEAR
ncbi:MAG: hypothetical protein HZB55_07675 [Deltaproteobacteria bacterium]|nr:hypothetical protein [Deltaproteobacteria bacterium]